VTITVGMVMAALTIGCDDHVSRIAQDSPPVETRVAQWRVHEVNGNRSVRIAVEHEAAHELLAAAVEQARQTADEAREQWRHSPESHRHHWAVKWAAPVSDDAGAVEHVWVCPLHWSQFRVEGVLLSEPDRPLEISSGSGHATAVGDIVSFPADELSDWVRWRIGQPNGERDGGFTIDALERIAGKVP
jgi:uncharacterized protein YegJ (DUF2314 family)